jgi:predicted small integral membrane protein
MEVTMLLWIIVLLLVVGGGLLVWKSKTPEGFDWKLGLSGLGAIAVAIYEWFTNGLSGLLG